MPSMFLHGPEDVPRQSGQDPAPLQLPWRGASVVVGAGVSGSVTPLLVVGAGVGAGVSSSDDGAETPPSQPL